MTVKIYYVFMNFCIWNQVMSFQIQISIFRLKKNQKKKLQSYDDKQTFSPQSVRNGILKIGSDQERHKNR